MLAAALLVALTPAEAGATENVERVVNPAVPALTVSQPMNSDTRVNASWSVETSAVCCRSYVLAWRRAGWPWEERVVDATSTSIDAFRVGQTIEFRVRSSDRLGNRSAWSGSQLITMENRAPATPGSYRVDVTRGTVQASAKFASPDTTMIEFHFRPVNTGNWIIKRGEESRDTPWDGRYEAYIYSPQEGRVEVRTRARDAHGVWSPFAATIVEVDLTAPRIANLRLTPSDRRIDLDWEALTPGDIEWYNAYVSLHDQPDEGAWWNFNPAIPADATHAVIGAGGAGEPSFAPGTWDLDVRLHVYDDQHNESWISARTTMTCTDS